MTTTERIADAAAAWTDRAADALDDLDVASAASRAAARAGKLAEETAAGLRNVGPERPRRKRRRLLGAVLVLATAAIGVSWISRRA